MGSFLVMEYFCILIAVMVTQVYSYDKVPQNGTHTYHSNINFLLFILYYDYIKCNDWGKLDEEYTESLYDFYNV